MLSDSVQFGLSGEWKAFAENHPVFLERIDLLFDTIDKIFNRRFNSRSPAERVVFALGRLSVEDFMEILLLCGNGYGIGGLKLLRGLYEHAVTAAYIASNPQEAETFLEYHHIHLGKLFNHAEQLFDMSSLFSPQKIDEIRKSYQQAQNKFQEPLCQRCGTTRTSFSWSKLDIASMAHKANPDLAKLYLPCYFQPTLHAHATVSALLARLKETEHGGVRFDDGAQRDNADEALIGAHNVILCVLDIQNGQFGLGLEKEVEQRRKDFLAIWSKR